MKNQKKYNDIMIGCMESMILVNSNKSLTDTDRLKSFDMIFDSCEKALQKEVGGFDAVNPNVLLQK